MSIGTTGAWLAWMISLFNIDPVETALIGFLFFYLTLLVALIGTFAIIGVALRVAIKKPSVISRSVMISFRQAVWFSVLIIGALILISQDILYWWSILLFVMVLSLFELFFWTTKRPTQAINDSRQA